jgi:hypothetical protein
MRIQRQAVVAPLHADETLPRRGAATSTTTSCRMFAPAPAQPNRSAQLYFTTFFLKKK